MTNTNTASGAAMQLADQYAAAHAKWALEDLYGTSKSYTAKMLKERHALRSHLAAALASAAAPAEQPDTAYAELPDAPTASDAMVDAYLKAQREAVEEADRFGRPNIGGLHTNTVREACRAGLNAALEADCASRGQAPAGAAVEMHKAKCPALIGDACSCERSDPAVDKAWAQFCAGIGDGPDAPYPGMIVAFERYYSQSFTDKDWRNEASVWAAAWKQALLTAAAPTTQPAPDEIINMAREQGLPETETEGVFRVNVDDLGRMFAADRAARAPADSVTAPAAYSGNIEQELAMLIRRIVSSARRNCEDGSNVLKLANEAWVYLVRKGLNGSPLRDAGIESDPTPAAQAADSVLEDAARYRHIRDVPHSEEVRSVLIHQQNAVMDKVIDKDRAAMLERLIAARKQGANHD